MNKKLTEIKEFLKIEKKLNQPKKNSTQKKHNEAMQKKSKKIH